MTERPSPFDLVFEGVAEEKFRQVNQGLGEKTRAFDRDAILLLRPMVDLLRDLRPDEGVGEGMEEMVALVHLAFLYWKFGKRSVCCGETGLAAAVATAPITSVAPRRAETAYYVQVPPLRMWGSPVVGDAAEPLDGWFVGRDGDHLSLVAVFGMHPQRSGFTVVGVAGPRPAFPTRRDGSPLFAPVLEGGKTAGLFSVTGMDELLELAWRFDHLVGDQIHGADRLEVP